MMEQELNSLLAGCERIYSPAELKDRLDLAAHVTRPLRVKLGMDPTSPDVHLGHGVVLRKMRQFQDLGHTGILIIGDFTARIGDPTGRSKTRPVLTDEQIEANAATYLEQAGKYLDTSPEKLEIRRNSEWLGGMTFDQVLKLAARMTVGQMLKREDFRKRFESETPISIHELLYPLVQGWDSVNIEADVELGGTDQTYNNLVGRELQSQVGQMPQIVMVMPILRGTDGAKKMSKTLGNYIGVNDSARDVFGKTMSIPDGLLEEWYRLLTRVPEAEYRAAIAEHPMKAKHRLAIELELYPREEMESAAGWWHEHFGGKNRKIEPMQVRIPPEELDPSGRISAWKLCWLAHQREISRSEARRMVEQGAFEYDGEKIVDPNSSARPHAGTAFRAGRHRKGEHVKQPLVAVIAAQ